MPGTSLPAVKKKLAEGQSTPLLGLHSEPCCAPASLGFQTSAGRLGLENPNLSQSFSFLRKDLGKLKNPKSVAILFIFEKTCRESEHSALENPGNLVALKLAHFSQVGRSNSRISSDLKTEALLEQISIIGPVRGDPGGPSGGDSAGESTKVLQSFSFLQKDLEKVRINIEKSWKFGRP